MKTVQATATKTNTPDITTAHLLAAKSLKSICSSCEHQRKDWCTIDKPQVYNAAHCVSAAFATLQNLFTIEQWATIEMKTDRIIAPAKSESVTTYRPVIFQPHRTAVILTRPATQCTMSDSELQKEGW